MSLEVLVCTLSFLDINNYEDCSGNVALFDFLNLNSRERNLVLTFWLSHTLFTVSTNYRTLYLRNNQLHKRNGAASVYQGFIREWWVCGKKHRGGDLPASTNGVDIREWWWNGERHREAGPAYLSTHSEEWFFCGLRHRETGPALIRLTGETEWFLSGKRHREGGPAVEYEGYEGWYRNGKEIKHWESPIKEVKKFGVFLARVFITVVQRPFCP